MAAQRPKRLTRAEQQARTRAALLDAAARVFVERGFHGASIEAISAEAGYTGGAFYSNFDSKEQLFAELLQDRGFSIYRQLAADSGDPTQRPSSRELGELLAHIKARPDFRWAFRLFLELLAHAGRDERFRAIAAAFWTETRRISTENITAAYQDAGREPPIPPAHLATAIIALDLGLTVQHFIDPDAAPLGLYADLFELLFGPLEQPPPAA